MQPHCITDVDISNEEAYHAAEEDAIHNPFVGEIATFEVEHTKLFHPGSVLAGMLGFTAGTIGAGVLAVPAGFQSSGIALAFLIMVVVAFFCVISVRILVRTSEALQARCYEDICRQLLGPAFENLARYLLIVLSIGSLIGYVVLFEDLLRPFLPLLAPVSDIFAGPNGTRYAVSLFFLVILFPLLCQPTLGHIRFATLFGVFSLLYICAAVCYRYFVPTPDLISKTHVDVRMVGRSYGEMFLAMPIMIFSFDAMPCVFQLYAELDNRSVKQMTKVAVGNVFLAGSIYTSIGVFAYLSFGDDVRGNILSNYNPQHDIVMALAYLGCCFSLTMAFVVSMFPLRDCLLSMMFGYSDHHQPPMSKHIPVVILVALFTMFFGFFVPSIVAVVSFLGSLAASFFLFTFPALFGLRSHATGLVKATPAKLLLMCCLLCMGVFAAFAGTYSSYVDLLKRDER